MQASAARRSDVLRFLIGVGAVFSAACASAGGSGELLPTDPPVVYVLEVPASFDSTVKLAKFALGAIQGNLQLPRVRPQVTSVSLHYLQDRKGGGHTEVAVIAAVMRPGTDTSGVTRVELSAWMLDVAHRLTMIERRSGVPTTPITTNAPVLNRPRSVTRSDTTHFRSLEFVLESFVQHGARVRQ